jgi:MFS family permease
MSGQGQDIAAGAAVNPSKTAVFRHRGFALLLVSRVMSVFGNQMLNVAIGYMIWVTTKDAMNLAYVGLAQFAPALMLALFTGHVADQFDRRRVVNACYGTQSLCAALFMAFVLFDVQATWPLFVILVILGAAKAFYQPASQALLPNLVPEEEFANAVAWSSSSNKFATIAGPALAGLFTDWFGVEVVFALAVGFYAVATLLVFGIGRTTQTAKREPLTWASLAAGFTYMRIKPVVLGAISMDMFAVLFGGVTALLPIYATDILESGASGLGLLRSSPAVGALTAGLVLTQIPPMRRAGVVLFVAVAIYGLATVVFAYSAIFVLSMIALAVLGAADMVSVYIRLTLIQISTPDHMRGRVSAVNGIFLTASNELGEFRAGLMAAAFGAVASAAIGGIVVLGVTGLWWRLFPDLRRADRLDGKD